MGVSLFAANEGFLDDVDVEKIVSFEAAMHAHFRSNHQELLDQVEQTGDWNENIEAAFTKGLEAFKANGTW
jgi:F-type H+-transporting ATPase subunit alpha